MAIALPQVLTEALHCPALAAVVRAAVSVTFGIAVAIVMADVVVNVASCPSIKLLIARVVEVQHWVASPVDRSARVG